MKTNVFSMFILLLLVGLSACTKEEIAKEKNPLLNEIESYGVHIEGQEEIVFQTQKELLDYLLIIDDTKYKEAKAQFDFLNKELDIIYELDLVNKAENDPAVLKYMKQYEVDENNLKIGVLNFCHHDLNQSGRTVWTPRANALIRARNRDEFSSITAVTSQVLCSRTFFRGIHRFYWGTLNIPWPMNDNAASYY